MQPHERPLQRIHRPKPAAARDPFLRPPGLPQQLRRRRHARALDEARWGAPGLRRKGTREVARAHAHAFGQHLDGELFLRMGADPRDQFAQPVARAGLRLQRGGELRLFAATQHRQRQGARDVHRDLVAQVVLDQREREFDAGDHAR